MPKLLPIYYVNFETTSNLQIYFLPSILSSSLLKLSILLNTNNLFLFYKMNAKQSQKLCAAFQQFVFLSQVNSDFLKKKSNLPFKKMFQQPSKVSKNIQKVLKVFLIVEKTKEKKKKKEQKKKKKKKILVMKNFLKIQKKKKIHQSRCLMNFFGKYQVNII